MAHYPAFAQQLEGLLRRSRRVLLTITKDPDGDSLGSMLGLAHLVRHYQKQYFCFSPDPIPDMFGYLRTVHPIMSDLPDTVHDYDVVVIFDTGDIKRTPLAAELIRRDPTKTVVLNIDHHPTVTEWEGQSAVDHNFIDLSAGATTEMIYKLMAHLKIPIDHHAATSLLTGILTDTGHFSNQGTSLDSMDIAAHLMARGARHRLITDATMRNKSIGTLKLWGRALARLRLNPATGVASTFITQRDRAECGVDSKAATGISNFLNTLSEGRVALVLQEEPGQVIKGSLRTTRPDVDVADLAAAFGGGGHAKAAGFKLRGRLEETADGWRVAAPRLVKPENI